MTSTNSIDEIIPINESKTTIKYLPNGDVMKIIKNNNIAEDEIKFTNELTHLDCINKIKHIDYSNDNKYIGLTYDFLEPIGRGNLMIKNDDLYVQCLQILSGLQESNIVHLDFKLENMGIRGNKVILFDFGNAIHNDKLVNIEKRPPEKIMGSEFIENTTTIIDGRSDVWSLACLIFFRHYHYYPSNLLIHDLGKIENIKLRDDIDLILNNSNYNDRPYAKDLLVKWI